MKETKKQKTSIKKILGAFLALVLVAVISVLGTLAYLSDTSTKVENEFVGSEDIEVAVKEPDWEADDDTEVTDDKTGTEAGENIAKQYTPGIVIPKDPQIKNSTTTTNNGDYSEWVAMRVDYKVGSDTKSYGEITSQLINSFNETDIYASNNTGGNWIKISPVGGSTCKFDIYVYKSRLNQGATTSALFKSVTIKNNLTNKPNFSIDITGAAIKNENAFDVTENGAKVSKDALDPTKLTYGTGKDTDLTDYIIMDELVKLLTEDNATYEAFTGITISN